jgi:tetratricopeptide (TPR) repeat protein
VTDWTIVGARIRELRRQAGLRQQDLAGPGVSGSYVSFIEAGKRQPTDRALSHIAGRLGTSREALLAGIGDDDLRSLQLELAEARLSLDHGDAGDAVQRFDRLRSVPDPAIADSATWGLAAALEAVGDLTAAIGVYQDLVDAASGPPGDGLLLRAATALSRCYRESGDLHLAVEVGEQALRRVNRVGLADSDLEIALLLTIAAAHEARGDLTHTRALLERIRGLADALGTPRERGAAYWNAAALAGELGHRADAVFLIEKAVALFGEGDDERNLARLRNAYATLLMRHEPQRAGEALEMLTRARETLLAVGSDIDVAYCETEIARARTLLGQPDEAVSVARSALARLSGGARVEAARARTALGYALAGTGDRDSAVAEYRTAATALDGLTAPHQAARVWAELAMICDALGDREAADDAHRRALASAGITPAFPAPRVVAAEFAAPG